MKASILDIRKLNSSGNQQPSSKDQLCPAVVRQLEGHTSSINVVRFSPHSIDYLASSGECLIIWDLKQSNDEALFFKHAGHVGQIVDFEWNQFQPWSIISASDDIDQPIQGCSLQMFRPLDLLTMDESDACQMIEKYIE